MTKPELGSARYGQLLIVILAVAFLLRLWYLAGVVQAPDFEALRQDMSVQDYQARAMLSGDWTVPEGRTDPEIPTTPYYRPPGYAYLLAVIYFFTGGSYLAPRIFNIALGLLSILLMARLARLMFNRGVALITAALMATYWGLIYYEGEVNDPAVFVFLLPCLLLTLRQWGVTRAARWAALAGVITGVYALMRPNILLYGPIMAAWMLWLEWRAGRLTSAWRAWAGLAGATALLIAPVTARNYIVSGEFVPISTYFGENLLIGNSEYSDGYTSWTPYLQELEGTGQFSVWEYPNIVRGLGREVGNEDLTHSEASSIFAHKAVAWMRANKMDTLRLALRKAGLFWSPWEITENKVVHYEKAHYAPLKYLPGFPYLFALFLSGMTLMIVHWIRGAGGLDASGAAATGSRGCRSVFLERVLALRGADGAGGGVVLSDMLLLFYGLLVSYYLSFLPFFVNARARHPITGLMALVGAYGLYRLWCFWRDGDKRKALALLLAIAACYGAARWECYPYRPDRARWYYARADSWLRAGAIDKAADEAVRMLEEEYAYYMPFRLGHAFANEGRHALAARLLEKALSEEPDAQPEPYRQDIYFHIGAAWMAAGEAERAQEAFEKALRLNPMDARALNDLGVLLEEAGDISGALEHYRVAAAARPAFTLAQSNLCDLLGRLGDHEGAVAACEAAVEAAPESAHYRYNLAVQLAAAGRVDQSVEQYRAVLERASDDVRALNNLALIYEEQGAYEQAEQLLERALEEEPTFTLARANLGNLYIRLGQFEQGEAVYLAGLELAPDDAVLHNGIGYQYAVNGLPEQAREHYETALRLEPHFDRARINLISLHFERGELDEALRHTAFLVEQHPEDAELWRYKAGLYEQLGDDEQASACYRRARELAPNSESSGME